MLRSIDVGVFPSFEGVVSWELSHLGAKKQVAYFQVLPDR